MSRLLHLTPNSPLQINYTSFSTPSIYFILKNPWAVNLNCLTSIASLAMAFPHITLWQNHLYYFKKLSICQFKKLNIRWCRDYGNLGESKGLFFFLLCTLYPLLALVTMSPIRHCCLPATLSQQGL